MNVRRIAALHPSPFGLTSPKLRRVSVFALLPLAAGWACRTSRQAAAPAGSQAVSINVDVQQNRHPISPLVYGINYGKELAALNSPLNRMGGNSTTRYNWKQNADNRGNDWFFQSIADASPTPGERADTFVRQSRTAGSTPMITIPLIGYVASVNSDRSKRWAFSVAKYGPQQKTDAQYCPDAGNGFKPDGKTLVTGNNPLDANIPAGPDFMQPWVSHLTQTFGPTSGNKGVGYYLLDNEPALWNSTHRDVFPNGVTMDDLANRMETTARMIKSVDAGAKVCGPEEWGWTGYLYSAADSQWAGKNGWNAAEMPDRKTHNGMDIAPYLLRRMAQAQKQTRKRLLDVFTLHFYPQGGESTDDVSAATQAKRNRSTRALWDTAYNDESWIKEKVMLIPRMKAWVAQEYPGTRIGLTEYSWGAENHINGATAQADILGILGREGMDLATRWVCPDPKTPTFKAFQMYRNYDGKNSTFGSTSVACAVPNPDDVSAFAAQTETGTVTVMIVAKAATGSRQVTVDLSHFTPSLSARAYQLTAANHIDSLPNVPINGGKLSLTVPAPSVTLVVVGRK